VRTKFRGECLKTSVQALKALSLVMNFMIFDLGQDFERHWRKVVLFLQGRGVLMTKATGEPHIVVV